LERLELSQSLNLTPCSDRFQIASQLTSPEGAKAGNSGRTLTVMTGCFE
jgi:hypothetical protein